LNDNNERDPRVFAIPDTHGHAKGEHKPYAEERPLPLTARMLFLWFYHACRRGYPRFLMVADHMNYLTFEDPAAVNLVRRALKLAQAGDLYGAAETATVEVGHAAVVSEGLRRGMRYSIGAEVDNDPRSRPDAQNIVDAMRPDAIIRSVHFIPITHPVLGENWPWPFDNPEFKDLFEVVGAEQAWETYVNTLVDAVERLPGHIVGHFFVPAVFGHWPDDAKLDQYEDRILDAAGARGMAVEFNTRFLYRDHTDEERQRYLDANKRFLRKAKDRGVMIAIGSDAHSPKDQGGAFSTVLEVLDELDINEIVFPLAGTLRRVALRVVREPEPEPPPAPEPVPEPQRAHERAVPAGDTAAAEPAKPVRKARPSAKATRPPETSPERPRERPETSVATAEPPAPESVTTASAEPDGTAEAPEAARPEPVAEAAAPDGAEHAAAPASANGAARPPRARKSRAKPKPAEAAAEASPGPEATPTAEAPPAPEAAEPTLVAEAPAPKPSAPERSAPKPPVAAPKAPAPQPPASKPPAPKPPAPKPPAPKPVAVKPPPPKPAPAKAASKGRAAPAPANARTAKPVVATAKSAPPRTTTSKAAPVKAGTKKAAPAKASAKKAAPARGGAKKAAPAKKAAVKKAPPKKATPARPAAKKAAPKKTAAKKAPARKAPARKPAAKKTAKKTATKRR
jgi:Meckel syndrome type 1 protein